MVIWEYAMLRAETHFSGFSPKISGAEALWNNKDKTGKTTFDEIAQYGKNGWELVSVTPITWTSTYTDELLFTFKRPK